MALRYFLIFLFVALSMTACSTDTAIDKPLAKNFQSKTDSGTKISIGIGKARVIDGLTVHFMQLNDDSRCPNGTECFWAGNAQLVFLVKHGNSAETLTLNTHGGDDYPSSAVVAGKRLQLTGLNPYPATNIRIDPNGYEAQLTVADAPKSLSDVVIIDVRRQDEFDAGHYPGALHITYENIANDIYSYNIDKDKTIYLYCRSGRRASIAQKSLEELGFSNVINVVNLNTLKKILKDRK